jgi:hypothetical protein
MCLPIPPPGQIVVYNGYDSHKFWVLLSMKNQFIVVLCVCFFSISCAVRDIDIPEESNSAQPKWFVTDSKYLVTDRSKQIPVHGFFDVAPQPDKVSNEVIFVPLTPENGKSSYKLDLISGKKYLDKRYCEQEDTWESYSGYIERPTFTIGVIPRVLDQLGAAQQIIVFGHGDFYRQHLNKIGSNFVGQRVRVVGGVIQQYCKKYPCTERSKWLSRIILVAVDTRDKPFEKIGELEQLKKIVDWKYAKAFLENADGRSIWTETDERPAYRVFGNLSASKAMKGTFSLGHSFSIQEMETLRRSCHKLYDYFWDNIHKIKPSENSSLKVTKGESLLDKKEKIRKKKDSSKIDNSVMNQKIQDELNSLDMQISQLNREKLNLKDANRAREFSLFFQYFRKKYWQRYFTCSRFVRASNINLSARRHWVMAHLEGFARLEKLGYVYNCNRRGWMENPVGNNGKRIINLERNYSRCSSKQLDKGFEQVSNMMTALKGGKLEHYRYIEYDDLVEGTHEKIYSWVKYSGKELSCESRNQVSKRIRQVFPTDINWRPLAKGLK